MTMQDYKKIMEDQLNGGKWLILSHRDQNKVAYISKGRKTNIEYGRNESTNCENDLGKR